MLVLRTRKLREVNTDPQRRCYHGCNAKSEMQWSAWVTLESDVDPAKVDTRLKFWRDLNDYSVSVGGTRSQFEVTEQE